MKIGKLPIQTLERIISSISTKNPRVAVGPTVGEDAALIDMGDRYLVATTDPITFTSEKIGWYAVQINANDIAAMGGIPEWMMCNILLPTDTSIEVVENIFKQLKTACEQLGITIIGGHTEVVTKITSPIITGVMLGEVKKGQETKSSAAQNGDSILMTKFIPIEGCTILAREARKTILASGVSNDVLEAGKVLLEKPGISIVKEARIAVSTGKVNAMHDPTEGGLSGGLAELANASGLGLEINLDAVPIIPCAKEICNSLGLNPLGVIASGSLLITVPSTDEKVVIDNLTEQGIKVSKIGVMKPKECGLKINMGIHKKDLPLFDQDEVTRYLG